MASYDSNPPTLPFPHVFYVLHHGFHHHQSVPFLAFRKLSKTVVRLASPTEPTGGCKPWWIWKNFMVVDVKVLGEAAVETPTFGGLKHHQFLGVELTNFLGLKSPTLGVETHQFWELKHSWYFFQGVETPIEWEAVSFLGWGNQRGSKCCLEIIV